MTVSQGQFTLLSGRIVLLESLKQWHVYAGLLEGVPTRARNDAELQRLVDESRRQHGHEPFLITPVQERIQIERSHRRGEPARLPAIGCIGRFYSHQPARDRGMDCSDLTIIWFQDDYAFPLSPDVEQTILAVDWVKLARDSQY